MKEKYRAYVTQQYLTIEEAKNYIEHSLTNIRDNHVVGFVRKAGSVDIVYEAEV